MLLDFQNGINFWELNKLRLLAFQKEQQVDAEDYEERVGRNWQAGRHSNC